MHSHNDRLYSGDCAWPDESEVSKVLEIISMFWRCPFAAMILLSANTGDTASSFDISAIMQNAVDQVKGNIFSVLAIVVPAIAVVVAVIISVKFGIGWLKRMKG